MGLEENRWFHLAYRSIQDEFRERIGTVGAPVVLVELRQPLRQLFPAGRAIKKPMLDGRPPPCSDAGKQRLQLP
jgi:hypothetical protein